MNKKTNKPPDGCKGCCHLVNSKCDIKGLKRWQCVLGKIKYNNGPQENIYCYG